MMVDMRVVQLAAHWAVLKVVVKDDSKVAL